MQVNHSEGSGQRYYTITLFTRHAYCFPYDKVNFINDKKRQVQSPIVKTIMLQQQSEKEQTY